MARPAATLSLYPLAALDLKAGSFKLEHAGKMNFYLNLHHGRERAPDGGPSLGIILCAEKDDVEGLRADILMRVGETHKAFLRFLPMACPSFWIYYLILHVRFFARSLVEYCRKKTRAVIGHMQNGVSAKLKGIYTVISWEAWQSEQGAPRGTVSMPSAQVLHG